MAGSPESACPFPRLGRRGPSMHPPSLANHDVPPEVPELVESADIWQNYLSTTFKQNTVPLR